MIESKSKGGKKIPAENSFIVKCPTCGLRSSIILDHKTISDEKSLRLCLVCGHVFEYFNQQQNINLR